MTSIWRLPITKGLYKFLKRIMIIDKNDMFKVNISIVNLYTPGTTKLSSCWVQYKNNKYKKRNAKEVFPKKSIGLLD